MNNEEKIVRQWFLSLRERFDPQFLYHVSVLKWEPLSVASPREGKKSGIFYMIRPEVFDDEGEITHYLQCYRTFIEETREISYSDWVFREVKNAQISIVQRAQQFDGVEIERAGNMPLWLLKIKSRARTDPTMGTLGALDGLASDETGQYSEEEIAPLKEFLGEHCSDDKADKAGGLVETLAKLCAIPKWKTIFFVPTPIAQHNGSQICFYGFVLFSLLSWEEIVRKRVFEMELIFAECLSFGQRLSTSALLNLARKQFYTSALRSAVAAIMGRNMSHNIGSHAVWHIAQMGLQRYESEVNRFLLYLQKRMDFIAQVSTSPPSWCMTMKWNGTDESSLMMGFTEQKCLLDNIAWSYKVRYCDFWFRDPNIQNDEKPEIRLKIQQCSPPEDIAVDIPHGQIGAQAFYTILENLIRNTAKYGDRTRAAENAYLPLEFTVKIEEEWDDLGKGWKKNYYRVLIRDNWETSQETVEKLNDALAEPIVDPETGELKPGNWGMKEIKICAGYLRMLRPEEIDDKYQEWKGGSSSEPPLIEAKLTNSEWEEVRNSGHLTYILYLLRPKKALLVGKFSNIEVENRTKPKNTGGGYDDGNR